MSDIQTPHLKIIADSRRRLGGVLAINDFDAVAALEARGVIGPLLRHDVLILNGLLAFGAAQILVGPRRQHRRRRTDECG